MTTHSEDKRDRILDAAAELFASRPYHRVLLSDVARAASVGKGTLYLYFTNKDDLYLAVLFRGFSNIVDRLRRQLADNDSPPETQLICVVRDMVHHLSSNAVISELMRGAVVNCPRTGEWTEKRLELRGLIATIIRNGIDQGVFADDHPQLTAQYIPGMVRSICLFRPEGVDIETVSGHACDFILKSLRSGA